MPADLAPRYLNRVRALVVLEGDAPRELAPAAAEWVDALANRLREAAAQAGIDAVAEALISEVAGETAWRSFPEELRRGPHPERPGDPRRAPGRVVVAGRRRRARHHRPARAAGGATDSPAELREPTEALAAALPNGRTALISGGHLINTAAPEVLAFIEEVVASR